MVNSVLEDACKEHVSKQSIVAESRIDFISMVLGNMQRSDQNEKTKKYMQKFNLKDSIGKCEYPRCQLDSHSYDKQHPF